MKLTDILNSAFAEIEHKYKPKFNLYTVYSDPQAKAFGTLTEAEVDSTKNKLFIMVGLPGSGKSSTIEKLPGNPVICSADYFFEKSGEYKFDASKLHQAHTECKNKATKAMANQMPAVIIDNTNLTDKERAPYEDLAEKFNYEIIYVVFEPDKQDIKKLARRNLHGVDAAKLEIMAKRFRPPSGTKGRIIYK
jgi:predicted kinase